MISMVFSIIPDAFLSSTPIVLSDMVFAAIQYAKTLFCVEVIYREREFCRFVACLAKSIHNLEVLYGEGIPWYR